MHRNNFPMTCPRRLTVSSCQKEIIPWKGSYIMMPIVSQILVGEYTRDASGAGFVAGDGNVLGFLHFEFDLFV